MQTSIGYSNKPLHSNKNFYNEALYKNKEIQDELTVELLDITKEYIVSFQNSSEKIEWKRTNKDIGYLNYARIFEIINLYIKCMKDNGFKEGSVFQCGEKMKSIQKSKLSPKFKSSMVIKEIMWLLNDTTSSVEV